MGLPTDAASPSIVVILSSRLLSEIDTEHGWKALPLMWLVHALQTSRPQPYLGPCTPSRSRSTQRTRMLPSHSTLTRLPLRMNVWFAITEAPLRLGEIVGRRLGQWRHRRERGEAERTVVVYREAG